MLGKSIHRVVLAGVAVMTVAVTGFGVPQAAEAIVVTPLEPVYADTVFGHANSVGNGNLRCPTAADGVNLRANTSFEACAAAQAGTAPAGPLTNNNDYSMRQNHTDGRTDTFNNSSATIDIPVGASIHYAGLEWGGNTGEFRLANGNTSNIRACNIGGQQYSTLFPTALPPAPAAASPEEQSLGLRINNAEPILVAPNVTRDSLAAWPNSSERYYTGWADVTALFQDAAVSGTTDVAVSNIWAPTGLNCSAGWALTVVWGFDEAVPGVAEYRNSINISRGHVRQGAADAPTNVVLSGFEAISSHNRVGIVAYEGDRGSVGDRFSINGADVPEPTGFGTINDFFVSSANGSSGSPGPVNFSIDVNEFDTSQIPAGSTEATLRFRTNGDGFWMQSIWLEAPVATVSIEKTANITRGRPGDPVVWTIVVSNPSPAELHDVVVNDPLEPACNREIPSSALTAGSYTYSCEGVLPDETITNTATVTALTELDTELSAAASATVEVIHPALSVTKTTDRSFYLDGEMIEFTVLVKNEGDVDVDEVEVTDVVVPECSAPLGTLSPGESETISCSAEAPIEGNTNTAAARGIDPIGNDVVASDSVDIRGAAPALSIEKTVSQRQAAPGETVTFTVTATNTGNMRLDDVRINDALLEACAAEVGTLLPGESHTTTCDWKSDIEQTFVNRADVTGVAMRCSGLEAPGSCSEELGIEPLHAEDSATVTMLLASTWKAGNKGTGAAELSRTGVDGSHAAFFAACTALILGAAALLTTRRRSHKA